MNDSVLSYRRGPELPLLDMAMVVTYFILVRTVDFSPEGHRRIDAASTVAKWHALIFLLYIAWDAVTKICLYEPDGVNSWWRAAGARMVPTIICLTIAVFLWWAFQQVDDVHELTADFALLCLVMLFRALKNLVSAVLPKRTLEEQQASDKPRPEANFGGPLLWSLALSVGLVIGTWASLASWPLPDRIVQAIHSSVPDKVEPSH